MSNIAIVSHGWRKPKAMSKTARGYSRIASGDPAMAFEPSIGRTGLSPIMKTAACCRMKERTRPPLRASKARAKFSAADVQPLDQRLVAPLVLAPEIIQELATLGDELEQPASRVVVLDVALEMLGEIGDALRQDRHLYLRRARIAGFRSMSLDQFGFAFSRNRHRRSLCCGRRCLSGRSG